MLQELTKRLIHIYTYFVNKNIAYIAIYIAYTYIVLEAKYKLYIGDIRLYRHYVLVLFTKNQATAQVHTYFATALYIAVFKYLAFRLSIMPRLGKVMNYEVKRSYRRLQIF